VLRDAAAAHPGRIVQATSLGAEDMVVTDLIAATACPSPLATLDTGKLHAQTLALIPRIEARYGLAGAVFQPPPRSRVAFVHRHGELTPCTRASPAQGLLRLRKLEPLARMLAGRRPGSPACAASSRATAARCLRRRPTPTTRPRQAQPAGRLELGRRLALHPAHDVPYNPLHDQFMPSIGCEPCTRAIAVGEDFRAGRWWWEDEKRQGMRPARQATPEVALAHRMPENRMNAPAGTTTPAARAGPRPPRLARRRGHLHPARGGRQLRAPGPAVFRRQGQLRGAAPGREGLQERAPRTASFKGKLPFPLLHVDTGHNFPEVIEFRDQRVAEMGERLVVGHLEEHPAARCAWRTRWNPQRPPDRGAAGGDRGTPLRRLIGGARRDEEKARAKERIFSHRDSFGQWQPKEQRPELWTLFNTRIRPGEHFRAFPISNWTELDVWLYIAARAIPLPACTTRTSAR
jgi:sulfate adenylyltransferase subunit 2